MRAACPPWRTFSGTEYYEDWVKAQGDMEGSAGIKFDGERGESINLTVRYPLSMSTQYEGALKTALQGTAGALTRAVALGKLMQHKLESVASASGLLQRGDQAAFVMSEDRRVVDANAMAEQMFSASRPVTIKSGRVTVLPFEADSQFGNIKNELLAGSPRQDGRMLFKSQDAIWQITTTPLPSRPEHSNLLGAMLQPRRMVLVQINQVAPRQMDDNVDLESMAGLFGLTSAEIALCQILLAGKILNQAAEELGITIGTARNRLKTIFQKTDTSRQTELMMLLERLR